MGAENQGSPWGARFVAIAMLVAGASACGSADDAARPSVSVVRVFAAASLADAFAQLEPAFEQANPQYDLELNIGGSSSLRAQILAGAPADVFASANTSIVDDVVADPSLEAQDPQIFATNRLVIAVPEGNPANLSGIDDFANPELFLGLCASEVPCGSLAEEIFKQIGTTPSVDTREPDVRALLTKVAERELDGGLVYETDALAAADRVDSIEIESAEIDSAHTQLTARYPIVVLGAGSNLDGGTDFTSFVASDAGQAVLDEHGFGRP